MITDHHCMIQKKLLKATSSNHNNNNNNNYYYNNNWFIYCESPKCYQFVMNVRINLINCNRNVNRTIVFLILIYIGGWGNSTSDFQQFGSFYMISYVFNNI